MSLYDDNPLLLARPRPFWEEEEEFVVPPPVAPPAAPPPEVEGPGYASLEDVPPEEAPPPEVVGPGYASLEEIPEEQPPPEVEGPGYASLEDIPVEPEESFLGKAAKVGRAAATQLLPNFGQAKAVLKNADDWKRELAEVPGEASDYWEKMKTRWAMGREQAADDQLAYRAATGELKWEDVKDQLEPSMDAKKAQGEHWYSEGLLKAAQTVPAMLESLREGSWSGLGWGAAAGITAAATTGPAAGVAGPVSAGAGYVAGQAYGSYEYWRRQGTGSLYNDLRKEGIGHEIAKNVSAAYGVPYAGIEFLQLTKLVPGMKQAAAHAIGEGIKKRLTALAKEKGIEYVEQIGQETSQEIMAATSEAIGEQISGVKPPPNKKGIVDRALTTVWDTATSVPFLMAPKGAIDVGGAVAQERAIAAAAAPAPVQPVVTPGGVTEAAVGGAAGVAVPPPIPPTPDEAFAPPGVTITPAPGEVPVPPDLAAPPPPVTPPGVEPTGDERFAPPVMPTPVEPGQPPTPEGEAITKQVGAENLVVKEVADHQAVKLQSANAPKTAQAIQQVAQRSNAGATVSAAEFLQQARAQAAEAQAEAAEKAAVEAEKAAKETAKAAPEAAAPTPAAAPTTEYPSAVVVGGQVFTGATHEEATRTAHAAVGPDAMLSSEGGWVDPESGKFVSHEIYEAHRDLNTAIEEAGGNMEAPAVQEAQASLAEAVARDEELNNQITRPGGEQVIQTGIKGQQALVSVRPSQELAVPLSGVSVNVEGVTPQGQRTAAQRPAAQALNDARNDRTAFQILLNCLT